MCSPKYLTSFLWNSNSVKSYGRTGFLFEKLIVASFSVIILILCRWFGSSGKLSYHPCETPLVLYNKLELQFLCYWCVKLLQPQPTTNVERLEKENTLGRIYILNRIKESYNNEEADLFWLSRLNLCTIFCGIPVIYREMRLNSTVCIPGIFKFSL